MGKTAFVFPGQGSQYVGMGKEMAENFKVAKSVFDLADRVLGMSLSEKVFSGNEEELKMTEITQPAIVVTSIACLEVLRECGLQPDSVAGLSLGEYSALISAGSLTLADALPLVQKRGRFMQEAIPPGVGGMAAVIGLERSKVLDCCRLASSLGVVEPANYNTPEQIVIAGELPALRRACEIAKDMGARRTVELPVSVCFHCSLLKNVGQLLAVELDKISLQPARLPVVANTIADYVDTPEDIRRALINQVSTPVLWQDSMEKMIEDGYDLFIEVGPGKSLTGLMKKINPQVEMYQVEDLKTLEQVVDALKMEDDYRAFVE